ncbi:methyltransferase [Fulvivirgaceae bacterium PWU4]|uniref:Methyltransferase n=1 Tax=Chryseosolibacter histidini TaxID=2782349 RepID=A0AAP2DGZ5_9BACT|nr:class I SAM-dependent methyltransferase [Chryseosolibacter histidini]MBT1696060.1 methyltransferase [Chryseosolibacter histidini]
MEAVVRKPYQGVLNIVRFNWHFYVIAGAIILALLATGVFADKISFWIIISLAAGILMSVAVSLSVSYYIYDLSHLYDLSWLKGVTLKKPQTVINIHAGFDETSATLQKIFNEATLHVYDFYDPDKHTEISIERARKAYPSFPRTRKVMTDRLPTADESADLIFNIFALHEIRSRAERIGFLKAQAATLKDGGTCIVVEHLRDVPNFLAYNIGFLHFFSQKEWKANFLQAGFTIESKFHVTPFVSIFILIKFDGTTP